MQTPETHKITPKFPYKCFYGIGTSDEGVTCNHPECKAYNSREVGNYAHAVSAIEAGLCECDDLEFCGLYGCSKKEPEESKYEPLFVLGLGIVIGFISSSILWVVVGSWLS